MDGCYLFYNVCICSEWYYMNNNKNILKNVLVFIKII